eukprot:Clim_evm5s228 gene=Clim_evmTU5s228
MPDSYEFTPRNSATPLFRDLTIPLEKKRQWLHYLYVSHAFSAFGNRLFEFAVPIMLAVADISRSSGDSGGGDLTSVALFSIGITLTRTLFAAKIGALTDRWQHHHRVRAAGYLIAVDNGLVIIVAVLIWLRCVSTTPDSLMSWVMLAAAVLMACCQTLSGVGGSILVEKNWVRSICHATATSDMDDDSSEDQQQGNIGTGRRGSELSDEAKAMVLLSEANSVMRRIDLTCKFSAPVLVGVMDAVSDNPAAQVAIIAILLVAWNVVTGLPEFLLLRRQQALQRKEQTRILRHGPTAPAADAIPPLTLAGQFAVQDRAYEEHSDLRLTADSVPEEDNLEDEVDYNQRHDDYYARLQLQHGDEDDHDEETTDNEWKKESNTFTVVFVENLHITLSVVGLGCLYFTVLSYSAIMLGALAARGVGVTVMAVCRALASMVGLSSTFVFTWLRQTQSNTNHSNGEIDKDQYCLIKPAWRVAMLGVCSQWFSLLLGLWGIFVFFDDDYQNQPSDGSSVGAWGMPAPIWALVLLNLGVIASRWGLWTFDLGVLQMVQEGAPDVVQGRLMGVQESVNAFFELLMAMLVLVVFPSSSDFPALSVLSMVGVTMSLVLHAVQGVVNFARARISRRYSRLSNQNLDVL